ncbi:MAG: hypothetical protein AAFO79_10450, partial [Pseudomonadota bacterium]
MQSRSPVLTESAPGSAGSPAVGGNANGVTILLAAFVAGTLLCVILDALDVPGFSLRRWFGAAALTMFAVPLFFAATTRIEAFHSGDRRISPGVNALAGVTGLLGVSGLAALIGGPFIMGFDGLAIGVGVLAGTTFGAILLAPYLRKFGGYSLAAYLRFRFESRILGVATAVLLAPVLVLLVVAELTIAGRLLAGLFAVPETLAVLAATAVIALGAALSGIVGVTWAGAMAAGITLVIVALPVSIASVLATNLPVAPLTFGLQLDELARLERVEAIGLEAIADLTAMAVPSADGSVLAAPFYAPGSIMGSAGFVACVLIAAFGAACLPAVQGRAQVAGTVAKTRISFAWLVCLVAVLVVIAPSIAVFTRLALLQELAGQTVIGVPDAMRQAIGLGVATPIGQPTDFALRAVAMSPESPLVLLPLFTQMPEPVAHAVATGLICIAIAASTAHLHTAGTLLVEEALAGRNPLEPGPVINRLRAARLAMLALAAVAGGLVTFTAPQPIVCLLAAMLVAGSALLAPLVMSIWWKRITALGALTGVLSGGICGWLLVALADPLGMMG